MKTQYQPYHLVDKSPWPILAATATFTSFYGLTCFMHKKSIFILTFSMILLTLIAMMWWRDIIREAVFQGHHTSKVVNSLKTGMILFIISEVMFFFSFFWTFFHSSLAPTIEIGNIWPPKNIIPFNPLEIPLLNTIILLSSGVTVTWSHYSILNNNLKNSLISMTITILLGIYFTGLQLFEYKNSPFTISDSIYGSTFFLMTGFHGLHVIIGTLFLTVMLFRMYNLHFTKNHHAGLEFSIWYWHFVDVVWLFLYIWIYCWGS